MPKVPVVHQLTPARRTIAAACFGRVQRHFRSHRVAKMYRSLGMGANSTVLDIGGTEKFWRMVGELGYPVPKVTILNLEPPGQHPNGMSFVVADGGQLPFRDRTFDVVVCNSVIEHLSTWEAQVQCAEEIQRVGRTFIVQSPDRNFPIEPHFLAPFVHWLPEEWRIAAVKWSPWAMLHRPTAEVVMATVREIRLLSGEEMERLFPEAEIVRERFCGWSKSLVAVGIAGAEALAAGSGRG